jgi:hypothetical protein
MVHFLRPASLAPVTVLDRPFQVPITLRDRVGRWLPSRPGWGWAWVVERAVFGPRKTINLYAEIFELGSSSSRALFDPALGRPDYTGTNGLQVWLLEPGAIKTLRERVKEAPGFHSLGGPRVSTAEGIGTRLFQGQAITVNGLTNQVGLAVDYFARLRPTGTDLFATLELSSLTANTTNVPDGATPAQQFTIQTNLDLALRVQVPKGWGLFLLDPGPGAAHQAGLGVILDPL